MRTIREEKMARDLNLFPGLLARDAAHIARSKAKAQRVDEAIRRQQVAAASAVVEAQKAEMRGQEAIAAAASYIETVERRERGTFFLLLAAVGVELGIIVALAIRLGLGV